MSDGAVGNGISILMLLVVLNGNIESGKNAEELLAVKKESVEAQERYRLGTITPDVGFNVRDNKLMWAGNLLKLPANRRKEFSLPIKNIGKGSARTIQVVWVVSSIEYQINGQIVQAELIDPHEIIDLNNLQVTPNSMIYFDQLPTCLNQLVDKNITEMKGSLTIHCLDSDDRCHSNTYNFYLHPCGYDRAILHIHITPSDEVCTI